METKTETQIRTFTKEVPYLAIKLNLIEARELYQTIINYGQNTNFNHDLLEQLTAFLSDYESGKYEKLTMIKDKGE